MSDDLSCGTGVNCQEHEEKTWLKHKNVNLFSNDLTIIDRVYYVTIFLSDIVFCETDLITKRRNFNEKVQRVFKNNKRTKLLNISLYGT